MTSNFDMYQITRAYSFTRETATLPPSFPAYERQLARPERPCSASSSVAAPAQAAIPCKYLCSNYCMIHVNKRYADSEVGISTASSIEVVYRKLRKTEASTTGPQ